MDLEEIVALSGASSSGSNSNMLQLSSDLMVMPRISEGLAFFFGTRGGLMVHDGVIGCIFLYLYAYMYSIIYICACVCVRVYLWEVCKWDIVEHHVLKDIIS